MLAGYALKNFLFWFQLSSKNFVDICIYIINQVLFQYEHEDGNKNLLNQFCLPKKTWNATSVECSTDRKFYQEQNLQNLTSTLETEFFAELWG